MTPERIKFFLRCFYEEYITASYQGYEADKDDQQLVEQLSKYDVDAYFLRYLDVYIEHCDFMKEYTRIYNTSLFSIPKESQPESFNELEIFFIENIQLFLHTILEAAINTQVLKTEKVKGLKIQMKPVDNKSLKLVDLVDGAEKKMKEKNISPPAMG